jgi:hypothetical protein
MMGKYQFCFFHKAVEDFPACEGKYTHTFFAPPFPESLRGYMVPEPDFFAKLRHHWSQDLSVVFQDGRFTTEIDFPEVRWGIDQARSGEEATAYVVAKYEFPSVSINPTLATAYTFAVMGSRNKRLWKRRRPQAEPNWKGYVKTDARIRAEVANQIKAARFRPTYEIGDSTFSAPIIPEDGPLADVTCISCSFVWVVPSYLNPVYCPKCNQHQRYRVKKVTHTHCYQWKAGNVMQSPHIHDQCCSCGRSDGLPPPTAPMGIMKRDWDATITLVRGALEFNKTINDNKIGVPTIPDTRQGGLHAVLDEAGRVSLRAREAIGAVDNPDLDGTDGAHPAWWRGNDAGVHSAAQIILKAATTDTGSGVIASKEMEAARRVVISMRDELTDLQDRVRKFQKAFGNRVNGRRWLERKVSDAIDRYEMNRYTPYGVIDTLRGLLKTVQNLDLIDHPEFE